MNQTLRDAIREVEALSDSDQEELAQKLFMLAERKRIDAELAASEAEGGAISHEDVVAAIRARFGRTQSPCLLSPRRCQARSIDRRRAG